MSNKRLFVDMDGVLAKFRPTENLDVLYEKEYFFNLEPDGTILSPIKRIIQDVSDIDVYVLSSYLSDSPYALKEKQKWLDKYLPDVSENHRVFCKYGTRKEDKLLDVTKNDFLLDDYTKNLLEWSGTGIKYFNGINHSRGTWQGLMVGNNKELSPLDQMVGNFNFLVREVCQKTNIEELEQKLTKKPKSR